MSEQIYAQLSHDLWVVATEVQGFHRVDAETTNVFMRGGGLIVAQASLEHVMTQMRRAFQ
jgi:hypothetical protein